jgi:hypothetical protein
MIDLTNKFENEFDELVKIQKSILNPRKFDGIISIFDIFGVTASSKGNDYLKLYGLPDNKYFSVIRAYDALKLYGKEEIGKKIYNANKRNYVNICISKLKH